MPALLTLPENQPFNADLHTPLYPDHYREYAPHPLLENRVRSYWSMEELHTQQTEQHRFFPERLVRLCFYQGEAYLPDLNAGSRLEPLPQVYMLGFQKEPVRFISRGLTRVVGVELFPWAARELMHPGENIQNVFFKPIHVALRELSLLVLDLIQRNDIIGALEALEDWLLRRLTLREIDDHAGIQAALSLYQMRGQLKISELADQQGVSVRHLERQFQEVVGITPKWLSRIIRFEEAHNRLWANPQINLTELAFELGYADQAHFCREFRSLTHITPSQFSRDVRNRLRNMDPQLQ
ncbi:helix-turn-helix domain-containing protein [Deinococcus cellulosilyticus]|uniref:AraC family transcriptional regulator n=1 Tax=Deinococcus cellulosilyticus (strain DSM 18568 / NBRC 106333 / KACC 11606 / 5516J-15) TaxID=1223518 RepID=A0A511N586_DEIC1|nr:helix-turn-helix domain-containing protein [Deinococcus cellulosilyticus]GEM47637.1 AraC family transcriptional regulator [Deinococcus cellulosilyticus NBRC 106333 = KACC 11606]